MKRRNCFFRPPWIQGELDRSGGKPLGMAPGLFSRKLACTCWWPAHVIERGSVAIAEVVQALVKFQFACRVRDWDKPFLSPFYLPATMCPPDGTITIPVPLKLPWRGGRVVLRPRGLCRADAFAM